MFDYIASADDIGEGDLEGFIAGWAHPPSAHLQLLRGSEHVVLARDRPSGRVVGVVTAVGDGVLTAFLPRLESFEHQGRGIGPSSCGCVLALLEGRYSIDLVCDEALVPFCERFGMTRLAGMALRDRGALADEGPPEPVAEAPERGRIASPTTPRGSPRSLRSA